MGLRAIGLNCTLKGGTEPSNTEAMMEDLIAEMRKHEEIDYEVVRLADFDVKPGVSEDEGDGDDWPQIGEKVIAADVLVFGTPTWLGHPSSIAQRALERMDAWLSVYNDKGQKLPYGRVAIVAITGNEDGGHHVFADVAQGLIDHGFTVPPEGRVYWSGWTDESPGPNYVEANGKEHPGTKFMLEHAGHNAVVFAHMLRQHEIPALASDREKAAKT
jgi:multimeric flavodoxin WrbA